MRTTRQEASSITVMFVYALLCFVVCASTSKVLFTNSEFDFEVVALEVGLKTFNVSGPLVVESACFGYSAPGAIVFSTSECSYERLAQGATEGTFLSLFCSWTSQSICRNHWQCVPRKYVREISFVTPKGDAKVFNTNAKYNIAVGAVSFSIFSKIIENATDVVLIQINEGHNPWNDIWNSPGYLFFYSIFMIICILSIGFSIYVMTQILSRNFRVSVMTVIVLIENLSAICRIFMAFDFMYSFGILPQFVSFMGAFLTCDLSTITNFLISLFWLDILSKKSKSTQFLSRKFNIIFILITSIVIFIQILFLILDQVGIVSRNQDSKFTGVTQSIFFFASTVMILVVGIQITQVLNKYKEKNFHYLKRIQTISFTCFFLGILYLAILFSTLPGIAITTTSSYILFFYCNILMAPIGFVKLWTLLSKKSKSTNSKSTEDTSIV